MSSLPKKRDRTNENCVKAIKNIMWRCEQIRRRYSADKNRFYEYTSSDEPSFPRSRAEMENTYPLPLTRSPLDYAERRTRDKASSQSYI
ncbi:hypothetical protein LZ30DRAFT_741205 [Colletotrichum cereale]|nr:hypothetical protein LZ30DRAFT_741205 [Colletotrichum cereale]